MREAVSILHPYTVVTWKPGLGFQPVVAFSLPELVHSWMVTEDFTDSSSVFYCYTPSGCMFTKNAILKLGRKLWVEINS